MDQWVLVSDHGAQAVKLLGVYQICAHADDVAPLSVVRTAELT